MLDKAPAKLSFSFIYGIAFLSLLSYISLAYFTQRHETVQLFIFYFLLWGCFWALYKWANADNLSLLIAFSFVFRLALFFAVPNLSDDFYRFIWDGRLLSQGINPFSQLPSYYINNNLHIPGINAELYHLLNSPGYFTIYPPVCQFVFTLSAYIFPHSFLGSVMVMRLFILAAEAGSILIMFKLLKFYKLPAKNLLLYALNPLVIIELTGNLHFEAFMIFFSLAAIYFLTKKRWTISATMLGLAVASKLLPLIFLPLLIKRLGIKIFLGYCAIVFIVCLLLFLPLLSQELLLGLSQSIALYYQKFEFNGSIYYIMRQLGYWVFGFNTIQYLGLVMAMATFASIVAYASVEKVKTAALPESMLWVYFLYLIFATTIHPWYVVPCLAYCIFSRFRFPMAWAVVIFLTYAGYHQSGFEEVSWIIWAEYMVLFGFVVYELMKSGMKTSAHTG